MLYLRRSRASNVTDGDINLLLFLISFVKAMILWGLYLPFQEIIILSYTLPPSLTFLSCKSTACLVPERVILGKMQGVDGVEAESVLEEPIARPNMIIFRGHHSCRDNDQESSRAELRLIKGSQRHRAAGLKKGPKA